VPTSGVSLDREVSRMRAVRTANHVVVEAVPDIDPDEELFS
jgi:hypothetical protein